MSDAGAVDDALDDFLDKWRGRWPEWRIAGVFVSEAERPVAEAWFALQQEWTDAAWAGADPTPGFAKLGWWQEELQGWSKGLRRHPLGRVLQKRQAPWAQLAAALPALQVAREPLRAWTPAIEVAPTLQPLGEAMAACESALFVADRSTAPDPNAVDGYALLAAHALWQRDEAETAARARAWAEALAARVPTPGATRPRRIHDALIRGRLRRLAAHGRIAALPPAAALWRGWRAARG
ncbi:MAG: phytoene/squalene synthase family protein [Pseudomonadota bacterium]